MTELSAEALRELKGLATLVPADARIFLVEGSTVYALKDDECGRQQNRFSAFVSGPHMHKDEFPVLAAYIAAASPDVILALLAERERLLVSLDECHTLAIGWAAHYMCLHGLSDWCDTHKQIIDRAASALAAAGEE